MEIVSLLRQALKQALAKAYPDLGEVVITLTRPDEAFGDYSTALPLSLARQLQKSPMEIARTITELITLPDGVDDITVIAPGYINFQLSIDYLVDQLKKGIVVSPVETPEKILLEFGQPNTHKVPHLGHLFSYIYGESMARLFESVGHMVDRANYQGDVGLHVAKCLWAYPTVLKGWGEVPHGLEDKIMLLQAAYQFGSASYETPKYKEEIDALNTKIYSNDPEIMPLWDETRAWSLAFYRQFEGALGIRYAASYLESQTAKSGKEAVTSHLGSVFEEDAGAVVFRGEAYDLHTRVFINSRGNPTYEAKDVGLMGLKLKDFPNSDRFVVTTANEQSDYWRVVKKVNQLIYSELQSKELEHIGFGMINLTSGKMSSRTGDIITAFSLVEMVTKAMRERLDEDRHDESVDLDAIAHTVGLGAIKYSFLKTTATKNIAFDLETSIAKEGNSGPYLNYVYARCKSLLNRAGELSSEAVVSTELSVDETALLRWFGRYNEMVHQAVVERSPHYVASYLFELAQRFNTFYNNQPILQSEGDIRTFRLHLVDAVANNMAHGLKLLGVDVVDQL